MHLEKQINDPEFLQHPFKSKIVKIGVSFVLLYGGCFGPKKPNFTLGFSFKESPEKYVGNVSCTFSKPNIKV